MGATQFQVLVGLRFGFAFLGWLMLVYVYDAISFALAGKEFGLLFLNIKENYSYNFSFDKQIYILTTELTNSLTH